MNQKPTKSVLIGIVLVCLIVACQSESQEQAQIAAEPPPTTKDVSPYAEADSLLYLVNDRMRRRQMSTVDSLLSVAAGIYQSGPANDSLAQVGFLKTQTYRASYFRELGQLDQCLSVWNAHFPTALSRFGDQHAIVATFYNVKSAYFIVAGNMDSSRVYAEKAISALASADKPDTGPLFSAHLRLTRVAFQSFDLLSAMHHSQKAIEYAATANQGGIDSVGLGAAYNLRAGVHYHFQELEQTLEMLHKAYELTAANPFWEANYKMNVAGVLAEAGNLEESLTLNQEAMAILKSMKQAPQENLSIARYNFGIIYMDMAKYDSAEVYLADMLAWRKANTPNDLMLISTNQNSLAYVYTKQGKLDKANALFRASEATYAKVLPPFHPGLNRYHLLLTDYHEAAGNLREAASVAQKALNSATKSPGHHGLDYNPDIDDILLKDHAVKAYEKKARFLLALAIQENDASLAAQALDAVAVAVRLLDNMRADYQQVRFRRLLNEHARSIYSSGVKGALLRHAVTGNEADLALAFSYSTRSKSGQLHDIQRNLRARQYADIPAHLKQREDSLQTVIWRNEMIFKRLQQQQAMVQAKSIEDSLHGLWIRLGEFRRTMQQSYPVYRALMFKAPEFDVTAFRKKAIDEHTVVIDVFNDQDSLHFFAMSQDRLLINSVAFDEVFRKKLRLVSQHVSGAGGEFASFAKNSFDLYQQLLKPLEELLEDRKIIFIPDQAVYSLPIAALLTATPPATGVKSYADLPYLIRSSRLRHTYAASLLTSNEDRGALPAENSFIGYAPGFLEGLPDDGIVGEALMSFGEGGDKLTSGGPLPYSADEVQQIRQAFLNAYSSLPLWLAGFFDQATDLRINQDANETQMLADVLDQYRYVHFSTHGFYYQEPQELAGLILYPDSQNDGIVLAEDIYRLNLNAELIVLSACQTGLGEWTRGEGLIGPAQAFLQAGARNLLVTLWQTENRSARELMIRFYQEMLNGRDKDKALQVAQLAMLETSDFQHPRYWAPYILIGEASE